MATKFKRTLSMLLAIVMCVSCIAFPAFAEEGEDIYIPEPPTKVGNNYPLSKTATALKDDLTTVTLSVPAEEVALGVDIVYVAGAYLAKDAVENDLMVESLYSTFEEAIKAGVPVSFGFVPFSYNDQPVMDLNTHKYDTVEKLEADFRNDLRQAIEDAGGAYGGENMENALQIAKNMFAASDLADHPERQHLVLVSSGHTYNFNVGENNDIFSTVPVAIHGSEAKGKYYYGFKAWMQARNYNPNNYPIPRIFTTYQDYRDFDAYWAEIEKWVAADVAAGDKVVYNISDTTDPTFTFDDWMYNADYAGQDSKNTDSTFYAYGYYLHTATAVGLANGFDFANVPRMSRGSLFDSIADNEKHAISYERAMWEASNFIDKEITGTGINFYPIYNQMKPEYTNGKPCAGGGTNPGVWTDQYIGHSFMNMLARNAGRGIDAINNSTATDKAFFDPIKEAILYTVSNGSKVTDAIGYDAKEGNFEFITDVNTIKLTVNGVDYTTYAVDARTNEDGVTATASYDFFAPDSTREFSLDYYYGDGKTGEYFDWNFHTDVSMKDRVTLTYDLKLIDKSEKDGTHYVDTNRFAALYPVDSDGKKGTPQLFPVPEVEYEVVPYDVDIVLALGAGIAQYDGVHSKYSHTYNSIVNLVEPLVSQGINVKLGLVAVEHYDDVAMPLTVLTKDNYEEVITDGLNTIQSMPAGPTNLHGNIVAAKEMLDADTSVPAANKFFYVIATGRTYNYDNAAGVPTTIVNKIALKGNTYYYWGHYLWQSQRGRHTSLYMIPDCYNNDFSAYWADVCKWVEADRDTYAYSFTDAYNVNDPQWFNTFYAANTKDAKALGLASSRFGWILNDLTNSGRAGIGSGANPQNALNYERAQYEAYQAYQAMKDAGYTCEAISSESANYSNGSEYIKLGAKYTGTSTIQLGDSFMDFLNGGNAKNLFDYERNEDGSMKSTTAVFAITDYFTKINVADLVKSDEVDRDPVMMSPAPPSLNAGKPNEEIFDEVFEDEIIEEETVELVITEQPKDVEGAIGDTVSVTVEAEGEGLKYQWFFRNAGAQTFAKSSTKTATYEVEMTTTRANREVYCVITDAYGNSVTSETATLIRIAASELKIDKQPEDAEGAIGETVSVAVEAEGEGLKYQWYYRNAGAEAFAKSSTRTATYEVEMTTTRAGREVYCVITDAFGNSVTSETATLIRVATEELKIVKQPEDAEGAIGETVSVTVEAQGEGLKYQWFFCNAGGTSFSKSSTRTATYEAEMNTARAGREVYCVITDAFGNTVTSDTVTLIRVAAEELEIVKQPESVEGAIGDIVSVTVEAKGEGLKYQWFFRNAGGTSFSKSSTKVATYEVEMNKSRANREVYCVITDALGNTVTTDTVTLGLSK